jgi:hypothetical protein
MENKDQIVFETLETSDRGWEFTGHIEVEGDLLKAALSKPFELPIFNTHDCDRPLGKIRSSGDMKVSGVINCTVMSRMDIGIGFHVVKSRAENGIRILEEVRLIEISIIDPRASRPSPATIAVP